MTSDSTTGTQADPHKVVIIGSGPAGWTAAIYAARADLWPVCYVGVPKSNPAPVLPGGQLMLTTDVENYPGFPEGVQGPEMMSMFRKQAERFDTRTFERDVETLDTSNGSPFRMVLDDGSEVWAHAVIVATGATANWLGLDNELRLATSGGGVSACAVCDGALPVFRDKPLAVVGGGDTAMEEAMYLTKFASTVYVIHRRDEFRASRTMQQRLLAKDNVEVLWNKQVVDVLGDDLISGVKLQDTVTGEQSVLEVGGMFLAIGHTPATKFLDGSGLAMDDHGYLELKTRGSETNIEGVFAAGDVADAEYRQAITAAGMGCQAALDAERWLGDHGVG